MVVEFQGLTCSVLYSSFSMQSTCAKGYTGWYSNTHPVAAAARLEKRLSVYISVRAALKLDLVKDKPSPDDMQRATEHILASLGYPLRDPLVLRMRQFPWGVQNPLAETTNRLHNALEDVFVVLLDDKRRRQKAGASDDEATGLVVIDEFADLLSDAVKDWGGRSAFKHICELIVQQVVNQHNRDTAARVLLAGSSNFIRDELNKTKLIDTRVHYVQHLDAPREKVEPLLLRCGYSSAEVDDIIAVCGTRLRLLKSFRDAPLAVAEKLKEQEETACNFLRELFKQCKPKDRRLLEEVLDDFLKAPTLPARRIEPFLSAPSFPRVFYFFKNTARLQDESIKYAWTKSRADITAFEFAGAESAGTGSYAAASDAHAAQ